MPPIHRATHRIGIYLAELREDALSQGEAHILALLAHAAPASIAALHDGLAHKRSTLTSILDRLADRGLVTRTVGHADRRTFIITPTARGLSFVESDREPTERITRVCVGLDQALRWVMDGTISHAASAVLIFKAARLLEERLGTPPTSDR